MRPTQGSLSQRSGSSRSERGFEKVASKILLGFVGILWECLIGLPFVVEKAGSPKDADIAAHGMEVGGACEVRRGGRANKAGGDADASAGFCSPRVVAGARDAPARRRLDGVDLPNRDPRTGESLQNQ